MKQPKVTIKSIEIFLRACRTSGEDTVIKLLQNLGSKEKMLEKFIEITTLKEFNVLDKKALKKNYQTRDCFSALSFLKFKYLNHKPKDIALYLDLAEITVYKYLKYVESLDESIKYQKELITKIDNIDKKITEFIDLSQNKTKI